MPPDFTLFIPRSWATSLIGGNSHLFALTGHYEWGHSWQQWSVPFRWSPWQRLQTARAREVGRGERDRECRSIALRSVDPCVLHFFSLHVTFYSACMKRRTDLTQNYLHIITLNVLQLPSSQTLCSNIHLHKDWRCQKKPTPTQASAARESWEGRSTFFN